MKHRNVRISNYEVQPIRTHLDQIMLPRLESRSMYIIKNSCSSSFCGIGNFSSNLSPNFHDEISKCFSVSIVYEKEEKRILFILTLCFLIFYLRLLVIQLPNAPGKKKNNIS